MKKYLFILLLFITSTSYSLTTAMILPNVIDCSSRLIYTLSGELLTFVNNVCKHKSIGDEAFFIFDYKNVPVDIQEKIKIYNNYNFYIIDRFFETVSMAYDKFQVFILDSPGTQEQKNNALAGSYLQNFPGAFWLDKIEDRPTLVTSFMGYINGLFVMSAKNSDGCDEGSYKGAFIYTAILSAAAILTSTVLAYCLIKKCKKQEERRSLINDG